MEFVLLGFGQVVMGFPSDSDTDSDTGLAISLDVFAFFD